MSIAVENIFQKLDEQREYTLVKGVAMIRKLIQSSIR